jgi:hypothetical protein
MMLRPDQSFTEVHIFLLYPSYSMDLSSDLNRSENQSSCASHPCGKYYFHISCGVNKTWVRGKRSKGILSYPFWDYNDPKSAP